MAQRDLGLDDDGSCHVAARPDGPAPVQPSPLRTAGHRRSRVRVRRRRQRPGGLPAAEHGARVGPRQRRARTARGGRPGRLPRRCAGGGNARRPDRPSTDHDVGARDLHGVHHGGGPCADLRGVRGRADPGRGGHRGRERDRRAVPLRVRPTVTPRLVRRLPRRVLLVRVRRRRPPLAGSSSRLRTPAGDGRRSSRRSRSCCCCGGAGRCSSRPGSSSPTGAARRPNVW